MAPQFVTAKGKLIDKNIDIRERYTAVWVKRTGRWQLVAEQRNLIKQNEGKLLKGGGLSSMALRSRSSPSCLRPETSSGIEQRCMGREGIKTDAGLGTYF